MVAGKKQTTTTMPTMQLPVAALTRYRPDIHSLSRAREQTDYIRQGVKVGATGIFLPFMEKVEIIEVGSVCPIPNTPMWFTGMINNRGNLLPVFDLKMFMGMDAGQSSHWLMILGSGGKACGLSIDTLPVLIANPQPVDVNQVDAQEAGLPDALRAYLAGAYLHNGAYWLDVAYDRLFGEICARF